MNGGEKSEEECIHVEWRRGASQPISAGPMTTDKRIYEPRHAADEGLKRAKQRDHGMRISLRIDIQLAKERRDGVNGGGRGQKGVQTESKRLVVVKMRVGRRLSEESECIAQLPKRGFIERLVAISESSKATRRERGRQRDKHQKQLRRRTLAERKRRKLIGQWERRGRGLHVDRFDGRRAVLGGIGRFR